MHLLDFFITFVANYSKLRTLLYGFQHNTIGL